MMPLAIMFKEAFNMLNLNLLGVTALVIFVATFVATAIWAAAQERAEVRRWSDLPLDDGQRLQPPLDEDAVQFREDRP
jgi:hypothetical protein